MFQFHTLFVFENLVEKVFEIVFWIILSDLHILYKQYHYKIVVAIRNKPLPSDHEFNTKKLWFRRDRKSQVYRLQNTFKIELIKTYKLNELVIRM